ncbi:hypothetical protein ACLOJK_036403, partial [Asimina triloba]
LKLNKTCNPHVRRGLTAEEAMKRCWGAGEAAGATETALREERGAVAAAESVGQFSPATNVMAVGEKSMWRYDCHVIDVRTWMKQCGMAGSKDLWSLRANPPPSTNPKATTVDMIFAKRNTSCSVSSDVERIDPPGSVYGEATDPLVIEYDEVTDPGCFLLHGGLTPGNFVEEATDPSIIGYDEVTDPGWFCKRDSEWPVGYAMHLSWKRWFRGIAKVHVSVLCETTLPEGPSRYYI